MLRVLLYFIRMTLTWFIGSRASGTNAQLNAQLNALSCCNSETFRVQVVNLGAAAAHFIKNAAWEKDGLWRCQVCWRPSAVH